MAFYWGAPWAELLGRAVSLFKLGSPRHCQQCDSRHQPKNGPLLKPSFDGRRHDKKQASHVASPRILRNASVVVWLLGLTTEQRSLC